MSDNPIFPDLSEHLSCDLQRALDSYQRFEQGDIPTDPKGFTTWHNACKSALLHIALLIKLIQTTHSHSNVTTKSPTVDWIKKAQNAIKQLPNEDWTTDAFFD